MYCCHHPYVHANHSCEHPKDLCSWLVANGHSIDTWENVAATYAYARSTSRAWGLAYDSLIRMLLAAAMQNCRWDRPELARSSFPHAHAHAHATRESPGPGRARPCHASVPLACFAMWTGRWRRAGGPDGWTMAVARGRVDWLINYLGEPDRVGNGRWCVCQDDDDNPSWWFIRS
jgi:hypothetical protein